MHRKMVKSDLISGHIWPGQDMAGYENLAGFRPGPDMISGATLLLTDFTLLREWHVGCIEFRGRSCRVYVLKSSVCYSVRVSTHTRMTWLSRCVMKWQTYRTLYVTLRSTAVPCVNRTTGPVKCRPRHRLPHRYQLCISNFLCYCVHGVPKNYTDVAHYNFNAHQVIFVIFSGDVAERVCYQTIICYPNSPNYCICTTWEKMNMNLSPPLDNIRVMVIVWR